MWESYSTQPWLWACDLLLCSLAAVQLLRLWDRLNVVAAARVYVANTADYVAIAGYPRWLAACWDWLAELLHCKFCFSHWLAAGCLLLRAYGGAVGFYLLSWLAVTAVVRSIWKLLEEPE